MSGLDQTDQRALRSIAAQFWVNGAVVASYVPRLPGIRDKLNIDLSTIGALIAVATGAGLLGSVMVGSTVERFGTKRVMIVGGAVLVLALPFVSIAPSAAALLVVLAVIAVADVLTDVAMNIQGSAISARRHVPVMNRLHAMWSLGTVVGGLVAAGMAAWNVDLRVHLVIASLVLSGTLFYVAPGLLTSDAPASHAAGSSSTNNASTTRIVLIFAALGGAAVLPELINSDWAAFRLTDDLGASEGLAGLGYVAFTSGMVAGRFSGDAAVQRFGGGTVLHRATVLAAVSILAATLVPSTAVVFIGLFFAGIGVSVMFPQLYDEAARSPRPGKALGGLTAGTRIALLGAPLLVGLLADSETFNVGSAIAMTTVPAAVLVLMLSNRLQLT